MGLGTQGFLWLVTDYLIAISKTLCSVPSRVPLVQLNSKARWDKVFTSYSNCNNRLLLPSQDHIDFTP